MEILELLALSFDPVPITELIRKVGIKHIKAKKLLDSMQNTEWIREIPSPSDDQRFGRLYILGEKGEDILTIYTKKLKELFDGLND